MDFSYIVKILFISINTVLTFATFYESVSVAQPKCDGIKQKSGLSKIECILVCQRKKKVGALKGGHCICFETSCTSSEETDRDRVNPQMTTVFRKMVKQPKPVCIQYGSKEVCCPEGWLGRHCEKEAHVFALPAPTVDVPILRKHIPQTTALTFCGWLNPIAKKPNLPTGHIIVIDDYVRLEVNGNHMLNFVKGTITQLTSLPSNEWLHICVSWHVENSHGHMIAYQNGKPITHKTSATPSSYQPVSANNYNIAIGNDLDYGVADNANQAFLGRLMDWNVYSKKLSHDEVISVYHGEQISDQLVVAWHEFMAH